MRTRAARRAIALFLVLGLSGAAATLWVGRYLSRTAPDHIGTPPSDLRVEPVAMQSESGSTIHGWFVPAGNPRAAVLLLPSIRANRLSMVPRARFLNAAGYAALLIDFQGTGESPGEVITFGWRERLDVLAAVRWLKDRVANRPVGIVGTSLGGAATLFATPPLQVDGAVLEAVYPAFDRALENRIRMRLGPAAPALAPLLLLQLKPRIGVEPARLRPADHIASLRCPVFVVGGTADRHTTEAETRLLYEAAAAPKELWLIPGAAHVDFYDAVGAPYRDRILAFFEKAFDR